MFMFEIIIVLLLVIAILCAASSYILYKVMLKPLNSAIKEDKKMKAIELDTELKTAKDYINIKAESRINAKESSIKDTNNINRLRELRRK